MGAGHRQRQSSSATSAPHGHSHQRNSQSALALAFSADGRGIGRRRGNSGRAFAGVCHRLVSPSRHYGCYVCRRPRTRACRSHHKEKRRKRSQPRRSLFQRPDCRRRRLWPAWRRHRSSARPGNSHSRAALADRLVASSLARRSFRLRSQNHGISRHQQPVRHFHVRPSRGLALLFRPQEARLAVRHTRFDAHDSPPYTAIMGTRIGMRRYNFDWRSFITPGVKLVVLVCTGAFLIQTFAFLLSPPAYNWILKWFGLIPAAVTHLLPPRIWQPFTYIFLHGGLWHLLINMLMLWMFGRELELVWGKKRFLNYFFICGVGAGIITILVKVTPMLWGNRPYDIPTIGASGAIFGILIANAILFPDRRIWLFPLPLTIPMRPFVAVMR